MLPRKEVFIFCLLAFGSTAGAHVIGPRHHDHECRRPTYATGFGHASNDIVLDSGGILPAIPFTDLVVFGDSMSEVGNVYRATNGTHPGPWSFDGRFSDGRAWEEYLVQFFNLSELSPSSVGGTVYAWGGATTDNGYINASLGYLTPPLVPSVHDQISTYLDARDGIGSAKHLHVLFSGYNDYWRYVDVNFTTSRGQDLNLTNVYTTVVDNIIKNVRRLYDSGARTFLVANAVNMSTWVAAGGKTRRVLDACDVLVSGHNSLLSERLREFEASHPPPRGAYTNDCPWHRLSCASTTVYQFDVFGAFECLNLERDFFGIRNIRDPCHPSQTDTNRSNNCNDVYGYKFWDKNHPTTHAHQIASMSAIQSIYDREGQKRKLAKAGKGGKM